MDKKCSGKEMEMLNKVKNEGLTLIQTWQPKEMISIQPSKGRDRAALQPI